MSYLAPILAPILHPLVASSGDTGLDINAAITGLFHGCNSEYCRRQSWTPAEHVTLEGDQMVFNDAAGGMTAYLPSVADLLALDWILV